MKKTFSVLFLSALLLTGCGNAAGTAESGAPAAAVSSADSSKKESAGKEEEKSEGVLDAEVTEYINWNGYDMPIPPGMEIFDKARRLGLKGCWNKNTEDTVFYTLLQEYQAPESDKPDGYTLDDLPEVLLNKTHSMLSDMINGINRDFSRITIDSKSEAKLWDFPLLRAEGTMHSISDDNIKFIAYYGFLDNGQNDRKHVPSCWIAYTCSDSKEALEQMKKAAELPLTEARLHPTED